MQLYNGSLPYVALIFIPSTVADIFQELFVLEERTVPFNQEITHIKLQWQLLNPTHNLCDAHKTELVFLTNSMFTLEPQQEISNNMVCATSKGSDQPAHMGSLIRAIASRLNIL